MSCDACTNGIIRSLGRDNAEIIENCPYCMKSIEQLESELRIANAVADKLTKLLATERYEHADTQAKWNQALDVGLNVVKERNALRTALEKLAMDHYARADLWPEEVKALIG